MAPLQRRKVRLSQATPGTEDILIQESSLKTANPLIHLPSYSYGFAIPTIHRSKTSKTSTIYENFADNDRNYLQSPYFFMCCALCDANLDRPGQLAAALQGDDVNTATQSALAGTLVSSLHRLKDVDNTGT